MKALLGMVILFILGLSVSTMAVEAESDGRLLFAALASPSLSTSSKIYQDSLNELFDKSLAFLKTAMIEQGDFNIKFPDWKGSRKWYINKDYSRNPVPISWNCKDGKLGNLTTVERTGPITVTPDAPKDVLTVSATVGLKDLLISYNKCDFFFEGQPQIAIPPMGLKSSNNQFNFHIILKRREFDESPNEISITFIAAEGKYFENKIRSFLEVPQPFWTVYSKLKIGDGKHCVSTVPEGKYKKVNEMEVIVSDSLIESAFDDLLVEYKKEFDAMLGEKVHEVVKKLFEGDKFCDLLLRSIKKAKLGRDHI